MCRGGRSASQARTTWPGGIPSTRTNVRGRGGGGAPRRHCPPHADRLPVAEVLALADPPRVADCRRIDFAPSVGIRPCPWTSLSVRQLPNKPYGRPAGSPR